MKPEHFLTPYKKIDYTMMLGKLERSRQRGSGRGQPATYVRRAGLTDLCKPYCRLDRGPAVRPCTPCRVHARRRWPPAQSARASAFREEREADGRVRPRRPGPELGPGSKVRRWKRGPAGSPVVSLALGEIPVSFDGSFIHRM